ncbi:MAG: DUF262 domain-containing protein [Clostridia bacterium]|nr:DUF262 domain-containing protein [Clostridia bacterium]
MNSTDTDIKLETKLVGSIEGDFFIPSYQRGYRWGTDEVNRLLDDVYTNGTKNYCLQPIVVRKDRERYELIDGQQRLTTLYLIYRYMHSSSGGFLDEPKFSLKYETREKSEDFLSSIDVNRKEENIDFWFICNAYETIEKWFTCKDKKSTLTNINKFFDENVKIIWYEVGENEDAVALFTRLNIGKIPLTSAELVKAMFLSRENDESMETEKQEEIALQWDTIEKELHNDSLWYFLTNHVNLNYQTRIDLILDLIANKPSIIKDKYYTFFFFDELKKNGSLDDIWKSIQHTFLILKDWYENHDLYHKIGYLIASGANTLIDILGLSQGKTKSEFKAELNKYIRNSIKINSNYADLSYEKTTDYAKISRLLLLFNVESVCQIDGQTQRFPFNQFKYKNSDRVMWSLEHIHAQQSEGMQKQEQWKEWLKLHLASVEAVDKNNTNLIEEMQRAIDKPKLERDEFESIQEKVIGILSLQGNREYLHSIANLALLNTSNNAALNNSTFDVKRNSIVDMDKAGQYIPFCTKMVFLKYYTPSAKNQLHFWGQPDRIAYIENINRVLDEYLSEKIAVEKETE